VTVLVQPTVNLTQVAGVVLQLTQVAQLNLMLTPINAYTVTLGTGVTILVQPTPNLTQVAGASLQLTQIALANLALTPWVNGGQYTPTYTFTSTPTGSATPTPTPTGQIVSNFPTPNLTQVAGAALQLTQVAQLNLLLTPVNAYTVTLGTGVTVLVQPTPNLTQVSGAALQLTQIAIAQTPISASVVFPTATPTPTMMFVSWSGTNLLTPVVIVAATPGKSIKVFGGAVAGASSNANTILFTSASTPIEGPLAAYGYCSGVYNYSSYPFFTGSSGGDLSVTAYGPGLFSGRVMYQQN
jgi:hypothetical protein